jgi:hypothetical protein
MKIVFEAPLNQVSFGNVCYNFLKEFYKLSISDPSFKISMFPIGEVKTSAFDKMDKDFSAWVQSIISNRYSSLSKDAVSLKLWHINGAEKRICPKQVLYTFYELDQPTVAENAIVGSQDAVIFSSSHASRCFANANLGKAYSTTLGFDEDFFETKKTYMPDKISFLLMGKFEKRKHTDKIVKMWAKRFGNNPKFQLNCSIINPFFNHELMKKIILGYRGLAWNINVLPYVSTNSEVNDIINSCNIDLSGLSGAEGWGLPAFNSTCLGKWSVVLNATSHKDWATDQNSILVNPSAKIEAYDGTFFNKGSDFNQGCIYDFNEDQAIAAMEKAVTLVEAGKINEQGKITRQNFTYEKSVRQIVSIIKGIS